MSLHVIIPMAGIGSRFSNFGFQTPKFLLPIDETGKTMIEYAIETLNCPEDTTYTFVIAKNILNDALKNALRKYNCKWVTVDYLTDGPACTALLGLPEDDNIPILVSNSDQILQNWNCSAFLTSSKPYDGSVLTYNPPYEVKIGDTDKHSYVNSEHTRFAEKIVLSNDALVGVHYFKNKRTYISAYNDMLKNNTRAPNGEFYLSLMYNSILSLGGIVNAIPLQRNEIFYPTGEPNDYFRFINDVKHYGPTKMQGYNFSVGDLTVSITQGITKKDSCVILLEGDFKGSIFISPNDYTIEPHLKTLIIQHPDLPRSNLNKIAKISNMKRGWAIGDFTPSFFRTNKFEVGVLSHKAGEKWPFHIHDHLEEYNHILSGKMIVNGIEFGTGDSFMFKKGHPAIPIFIEDCIVICVKTPSVPTDKRIL